MNERRREPPFHPAAWWGIGGILLLLLQALRRLVPYAWEPFANADLSALQWTLYAGFAVAMFYTEGIKGFHRQFSPRVIARARTLSWQPHPLRITLAPLFCMGLFHATRKRLIVSWALTAMIVLLVIFVRMLPYPWRGIVDGGVVVGLGTGTLSILYWTVRGVRGAPMPVDAEVSGLPL